MIERNYIKTGVARSTFTAWKCFFDGPWKQRPTLQALPPQKKQDGLVSGKLTPEMGPKKACKFSNKMNTLIAFECAKLVDDVFSAVCIAEESVYLLMKFKELLGSSWILPSSRLRKANWPTLASLSKMWTQDRSRKVNIWQEKLNDFQELDYF